MPRFIYKLVLGKLITKLPMLELYQFFFRTVRINNFSGDWNFKYESINWHFFGI